MPLPHSRGVNRAADTYTAAGQLFFSLTPLPSGSANNYTAGWNWYDAGGLRALSKNGYSNTNYPVPDTTLAGEYTAYVYDGGQPVLLLQRGNTGTWAVTGRMLVAGADRPLAGLYNGQTLAVVTDRSGTVQAGVQPSGAADQLATYVDHGPFGNVENPAGTSISTGGDVQAGFTGAGGTPNGLGLVYLRNRWYDPGTGRFLTQDPMGLAGGLNLYAYAGNNPTSFSDPFGLCPSDVGGDGKTASVDDCAQGVKDAWASKHIRNTSSNNTDISGVDHDLMDAVVRTSMQHRMDLGISAGREGGHSEAGHHADGRAVDINQLGDIRFRDMPAGERVRLGNMIGAEIVNRLPEGRALMLFEPGMAFNTQSPRNLKQTLGLMAAHWNHIHITVTAP